MKSILLSLSLLASATVGVLASEELGIDVTVPVECARKTRKGDKINVHYRGTLQSNGQQFDASKSLCHQAVNVFCASSNANIRDCSRL